MKYGNKIVRAMVLILLLAMLFVLAGCGTDEQEEVTISVEYGYDYDTTEIYGITTEQVESVCIDNTEGMVTYIGHEFASVYDENVIIVYFKFLSKKDDYHSMSDMMYFEAYQDGYQIDGIFIDSDLDDNYYRKIAKGKSLECLVAFKVGSDEEVYLRAFPIVDGCFDETVYQEQVFSNDLESFNNLTEYDSESYKK